jgi:hypothetical protein
MPLFRTRLRVLRAEREWSQAKLPVQEAPKIIDLCERYGVTGATLYPDFYGAARATRDSLICWSKSEWTDGRDIRTQTLPTVPPQ